MPDPIVTLERVGRRYRRHWAVRGVDLTVEPGEMLGIVGPDGAGKTTLLQMCAAILDPSEGRCTALGYDTIAQAAAVTSRIGYMSQGFTLYDRLSVVENLVFSARVRSVPDEAYVHRSARLLAMAGLEPFLDRPAGKLSGGMRKKLSLCTNLIHEPPLLILDEPGLGVDPLSRAQLWTMLESFRREGITILVATSYMDEAERCDRVLLLHEGSVLATDRPESVRRSAANRVFELDTDDPPAAALELAQQSELFGIQVLPKSIRFQRAASSDDSSSPWLARARAVPATLEDVFVQYSGSQGNATTAWQVPDRVPESGGVRADAVTVRFGTFKAVDGVSMEAPPGELLALLGPNGAGKTTLIRAFCGLVRIGDGTAWIGSERVVPESSSLRGRIGYMSQKFSLYKDLTPAENLAFFASAYGLARSAAREAAQWARAVAGLAAEETNTPVAEMSGATRQRLALACSVLHRPSVLFLDEPTSGVDPLSRYRFWQLIRMLASAGMAIVVSTHYLEEAAYCDRLGLMSRGRMIALGSLAELRETTGAGARASIEQVFVTAILQSDQEAS